MKPAFTALIIFSFIGIAVFGIFAMDHGSGHSYDGCLAAAARGTNCPKTKDANSFIAFHLDTFKSFSTAIFGDNFANALVLLLAGFFSLLGIAAFWKIHLEFSPNLYSRAGPLESPPFTCQKRLAHWLSLHENSPPSV